MTSPPSPLSSFSSQDDLLDSPFEIISRDGSDNGSTDGRVGSIYEGISSEDDRYPHPDEVRAFGGLDDMCNSITSVATDSEAATDTDEEDEEEEDATRTTLTTSAHQDTDAHDDFLQDHLGESSVATIFAPTSSTIQTVSSIEFSEPEDINVHIDKISVKHTIKEFSDEEAARFFSSLSLGPAPERVSATIRQTMSQRCLSTHEPFRALYVGNDKHKGDIILKLSRAITCSSSVDYNENKTLRRNTEGVYNIVPASSTPAKDRDVELMEASGFQIKVDTCIGATSKALESRLFRGDIIYTLTVDGGNGGKRYTSIPAPGLHGARVQPAWTFPHVAVFCVSEDDEEDLEMQDRQRIVWKFCERHAIPALFISDHPVYAASSAAAARWMNHTNKDAINICLESRDGDLQLRCPIDLDSFMNIDNRQMNQNLAYLTGLQEPDSVADEKMKDVISLDGSKQDLLSYIREEAKLANFFELLELDGNSPQVLLTKFVILCLILLLNLTVGYYGLGLRAWPVPLSDNGHGQNAPSSILTTPPTLDTITVAYTTTKTVVVPTAESSSFGGLLSDIAHTVGADWPKNTACSAEVYSDTEVLIKVPTGTKEKWLAKGAIDVDIFRGKTRIPSKLSSSSEGIIIEIPDADAYGVVNVSVVTTRSPKINETFAVDFGTPLLTEFWEMTQGALHGLVNTLSSPVDGVAKVAQMIGQRFPPATHPTEKVSKDRIPTVWTWFPKPDDYISPSTMYDFSAPFGTWPAWADLHWANISMMKQAVQNSSSLLIDGVDGAYHQVRDSVHLDGATALVSTVKSALEDALNGAQQTLGEQERRIAAARKSGEMAILKAQIVSKLWWLKIQGKDEAYQEYERQARDFMLKQRNEKFGKTAPDASVKDQGNGNGKWKV